MMIIVTMMVNNKCIKSNEVKSKYCVIKVVTGYISRKYLFLI